MEGPDRMYQHWTRVHLAQGAFTRAMQLGDYGAMALAAGEVSAAWDEMAAGWEDLHHNQQAGEWAAAVDRAIKATNARAGSKGPDSPPA